jgi:hypothetical protein
MQQLILGTGTTNWWLTEPHCLEAFNAGFKGEREKWEYRITVKLLVTDQKLIRNYIYRSIH